MSVTVQDRVIVVTGAGRGLGRAYAHELAARGAKVVVNDLGVAVDGSGDDPAPAEQVAEEIRDKGGSSIAHCGDASSKEGVRALIELALEQFGRIDGCIANAGIIRPGIAFEEIPDELASRLVETHVFGAWRLAQQAWPHFVAQGYGRLMLVTSSAGIYGMAGNAGYAMTKAAIIGLLRTLAAEGAAHGVLVNGVSPHGLTRMVGSVEEAPNDTLTTGRSRPLVPLTGVGPVAPLLMSEELPFTGRMLSVGGGRVGLVYLAETPGIQVDRDGFDPQVVNDNWAAVEDRTNSVVGDHTMFAFAELMRLATATD